MRISLYLTAAALVATLTAPTVGYAQSVNAADIKLEFKAVDANRDGFITAEELLAVLPPAVPSDTADVLAAYLVSAKDKNQDGRLSVAEFNSIDPVGAVRIPLAIGLMAAFDVVDADKDGYVTLAELVAASPETDAINATYLAGSDVNGDGVLSRTEWDNSRPRLVSR